jgi:hypothetical protein
MCTEIILIFLYLIILNLVNFFLLKIIKKNYSKIFFHEKCKKICLIYNYNIDFFNCLEFFEKKQNINFFSYFVLQNLSFLKFLEKNKKPDYYSSLLFFQFFE